MSNRLHDSYINDISAVSLMSDEEEKALAIEIERGNQEAVNRLVGANLRYVVTLANTYKNQGMTLEDLVSEGNIGLMKAAAKFSTSVNKRFASFAAPYICKSMESALRKMQGLSDDNASLHIRSVDAPIPVGSQNTYTLLNILENADAEKADHSIELKTETDGLVGALSVLDERERKVIECLYGIGRDRLTMMETAMEMDLKRERVRQVRDKALRKLKKVAR